MRMKEGREKERLEEINKKNKRRKKTRCEGRKKERWGLGGAST
jgi:hypothetical protein